jgi:hypothetical protein
MRTTTIRRMMATALAAPFVLLPATAADAVDLQPTVPGCTLQGGCPTNGTPSADAPTTNSAASDAAISWAQARTGSVEWDGECLRFVAEAYDAAGTDIRPLADTYSAKTYWYGYTGAKYGDTAPPAGALVFWDADSYNEYGHVAISLGDGTAISTDERSYPGVHVFSIADRNTTKPYLGYLLVA